MYKSEQTKTELRQEIGFLEELPNYDPSHTQFLTSFFRNAIFDMIIEQYDMGDASPIGFGINSKHIKIAHSSDGDLDFIVTFHIRAHIRENIIRYDEIKLGLSVDHPCTIKLISYEKDGWEPNELDRRLKDF